MDYIKELLPQILFFIEQVSVFSTTDLLKYLNMNNTEDNSDLLSGVIIGNHIAYPAAFPNEKDRLWISRHSFFDKKTFAVTPTNFELEQDIFIPGARFSPFMNPFVIPGRSGIKYEKKSVKKTVVNLSISEIENFYFLSGEDNIISILLEDCEKNMEVMCPSSNKGDFNTYDADNIFYVTAFDFKEIYSHLNVQKGDRLIFKLEDWYKGIFSLKKIETKNENKDAIQKWYFEFEEGLKSALRALPINSPAEDAVAFTFFLKQNELFNNDYIAMDKYFKNTSTFSIQEYGLEEKFWITDEKIPQENFWLSFVADGSTKIIDFFFKLKLPISEQIIQAFIFVFMEANYIHYRNDEYKEKCIKELCSCFLHYSWKNFDKICKECSRIIDKRYDFYIKKYNPFKYPELVDLRKTAVSFFKEILFLINSLRHVKMHPDNFKNYSGLIINQLVVKLNNVFNYLFYYSAEDSMYMENVYLSLEHGYDAFLAAKTNIQNTLSEKGLNKF